MLGEFCNIKILAIAEGKGTLSDLEALIKEAFPSCIYTAITNSDGIISQAISENPDVILLDIEMAVGAQKIYIKLNNHKKLRDVPVIFISKPINIAFLTSQIRSLARINHPEDKLIEHKYQTLFMEMLDGFALHEIICDRNGKPIDYRFLAVNPAFERQTGLKAEQIVGKTLLEVLPDSESFWIETYGKVALTGKPVSFESQSKELNKIFDVKAFRPAPNQFVSIFSDITDHRKLEELQKISEIRYRRLFESAKDGILILDASSSQIVDVNPFLINLLGYSYDELIGKRLWEIGPFKDILKSRISFEELQDKGYIRYEDLPLKTSDGRIISVEFVSNVYLVDRIKVIQCNIRDISDRKLALENLHRSEEKYRGIFENVQDVYYETSIDGTILEISPSIETVSRGQYDRNFLIGKSSYDFYSNVKGRDSLMSLLKEHGSVADYEITLINKDGSLVPCSVNAKLWSNEKGVPEKILGSIHDISERKHAEEKILLNAERLSRLVKIYQYNSANVQDFLDYALNEAIELTSSKLGYIFFYNENTQVFTINSWSKYVLKECSINNLQSHYNLNDTGIWGEAVRQRKDIVVNNFKDPNPLIKGYPNGHVKLDRFLTIPIFDSDKIVAVVGVANKESDYDSVDLNQLRLMMNSVWRIVKRKEAEERILKLNKAIEQSPVAIMITDSKGFVEYVNPKFGQMTGYTSEEVTGKNPDLLRLETSSEEENNRFRETIFSGKVWYGEYCNKKKSGEPYWENLIVSPILNSSGDITHFVSIKEDITEKKEVENKKNLLAHSLESISECVSITDNNDILMYVNEAFMNTYGYSEDELIGKHISMVRPKDFEMEHSINILSQTISGGWRGELINRRKDGTCFPLLLSTSVIKDDNKMPIALIGVAIDITEMKQKNEELLAAKAKAEENDRLKTAFLHNISHEIRTPMNAIVGFADLLNEPGLLPDQVKHFTQIIVESSKQLLSIITDIVNIATIEAGQERIHLRKINVNTICKMVIEQFRLKAETKKISLIFKSAVNERDSNIMTDETKLVQILTNLLSNALKFTDKGSIELGCQLKNQLLEFYVKDTGMGIPIERQEEIFKRFHQLDITDNRHFGGSGLGLSISKTYVELLGGKIWISSEPGNGSTFFFTIVYEKPIMSGSSR